MKTIKKYSLVAVMLLVFASCSNDDDDNTSSTTEQEVQNTENTINDGNWVISNFNDSGEDQTSDFQGYQFTFGDNGLLTATNNSDTQTGTWSVTSDGDNDIDLNIFFQVSDDSDFDELNEDWDVVSISSTQISLVDDSEDGQSADVLVFTKL